MSELRDWLRRHKFEQYAEIFEANDIDLDILPELSERDLEQLGVSMGNRRRLRKALAERDAAACRAVRRRCAGRSRTAPGHGAVLRHGRLHGAVRHGRSRASGRADPPLSGRRGRRDRTVRRLRRQIHGRRRAGLFRLSARLRGRGGAGGSRRDQYPGRSRRHRTARRHAGSGARRHRHRPRRGRRDRRQRRRAGARHRRRNAKSRGTAAGARRARYDPGQRGDAESVGRIVRARIDRRARAEGICPPRAGLARGRRSGGGEPFRRQPRRPRSADGRPRP